MSHQPHVNCSHVLSPHVVYDRAAGGYRAQIRCPCGMTNRTAKTLHPRFDDARAESLEMPLRIEPPTQKPRIRKSRAKPKPSPTMPSPAVVNTAWLVYWRSVCASVGHQSRL